MKPLTHRIHLLGQAMTAAADRALRDAFDLGFTEFLLLHGVGAGRAVSQGELSRFVGVGEAGVSRIAARLVSRGLLESAADPADRRRSRLALTRAGAALRKRADARLQGHFGQAVAAVAKPADMAVFENVLDALLARLEEAR